MDCRSYHDTAEEGGFYLFGAKEREGTTVFHQTFGFNLLPLVIVRRDDHD